MSDIGCRNSDKANQGRLGLGFEEGFGSCGNTLPPMTRP